MFDAKVINSWHWLWYRNRCFACRAKIDRAFNEIREKDFFRESVVGVHAGIRLKSADTIRTSQK
jgi:hypothetical protein